METIAIWAGLPVFMIMFWIIKESLRKNDNLQKINDILRDELRKAHLVNQALMDNTKQDE
jgi:hypothetical protein